MKRIASLFLATHIYCGVSYAQLPSDTISVSYRKPLFEFNAGKPTFNFSEEQQQNESRMLRYSLFSGYREGVEPIRGSFGVNFAVTDDTNNSTRRLYMYNLSIEEMITKGLERSNRVFFEVKNPDAYRYDISKGPKLEWMRKYAHCFELVLPIGRTNKNEIIRNEVCRILNLQCFYAKRSIDALVLSRTSKIDKIKSKGIGEPRYDQRGYFNNITLDRIGDILDRAGMPPFVDETNYKQAVDLDLRIETAKDLNALKMALKRYDLDLRLDKREIEVLVIKEL